MLTASSASTFPVGRAIERCIAVDRSSSPSVQYRCLPRALLLMSAVTNQEHTHEAHSNIPMLTPSPDDLPPDPYPFLGEAPAADPHLISSLREEPLPLPPVLRAARFWSKPPKGTHWTLQEEGQIAAVQASMASQRRFDRRGGTTAGGRCWAMQATDRPSLRLRSWGRHNRGGTFIRRGAGIRSTFVYRYKIRIETTWLDKP
jgi:hypothetical protein